MCTHDIYFKPCGCYDYYEIFYQCWPAYRAGYVGLGGRQPPGDTIRERTKYWGGRCDECRRDFVRIADDIFLEYRF